MTPPYAGRKTMQLTFLGATKTVTGSRYLLTVDSKKILVDCGLFQGYKKLTLRNWKKPPIHPAHIDAVILTHAHIDHSGYLPLLIKNGFKGKVFCTHGTKDLCSILLPDSGHIQEEDADRANRYGYSKHKPALPLYTREDALYALKQFQTVNFDEPHDLFNILTFTFLPAGHIIGASMVRIEHRNTSLLFSGDLGRPHDPIMKPPAKVSAIDYLVIESTYGDRLHERSNPMDQLAEVINDTVQGGGSVVIPAFAVARAQSILYFIYHLKKARRIPDIPVFLDSPMAQDVSDLLIDYAGEHYLTKEQCKDICNTARYIRTPSESKSIDEMTEPVIIISASGMLEGGRILHHLKVYLLDERNTILLTGYQDPGTRGDRLLRGEPEIKIHGEMYPVNARVVAMSNLSAHADYQEILDWLKNFKQKPKKVFITHGDQDSTASLKDKIENTFNWKCVIPEYLQTEKLSN